MCRVYQLRPINVVVPSLLSISWNCPRCSVRWPKSSGSCGCSAIWKVRRPIGVSSETRSSKNQAISENTFSRRAYERALARRRKWTWQSYLIKPVIRGGVDRRKRNNVVPHCGGRSIDEKAILDNALLILSQFPLCQSRNQQHGDHAQIHRHRF